MMITTVTIARVGQGAGCSTSSCDSEDRSCRQETLPELGASSSPACSSMASLPKLQPRGCVQKHMGLPTSTICSCDYASS